MSRKKPQNTSGTLRRIWDFIAKEKGLFLLVMLMLLVSSLLSLVGPYLMGVAVDGVISGWSGSTLVNMLLWLLLVYFIQAGAIFFQNYLNNSCV